MSRSGPRPGRRLVRLWGRWKSVAHAIGTFQARVIFSLLYFLLIPPFALVVRIFIDPLQLRQARRESFWLTTLRKAHGVTEARRQF